MYRPTKKNNDQYPTILSLPPSLPPSLSLKFPLSNTLTNFEFVYLKSDFALVTFSQCFIIVETPPPAPPRHPPSFFYYLKVQLHLLLCVCVCVCVGGGGGENKVPFLTFWIFSLLSYPCKILIQVFIVLRPGIIYAFLIHTDSLQKMLTALFNLVWTIFF